MRCPDGNGLSARGRAEREGVRRQAAGWFAEGVSVPEIAWRLRVLQTAVHGWRQRWRSGGEDGWHRRGRAGRGAGGRRGALAVGPGQRLWRMGGVPSQA
ncbi:helix-turn-helix domain-containing protein [Micromonospora sp. KC606]|uniref:helix-turn-helix domain-containing protein n=1 Tax=Micromonospora sp. KC606 TaxID=2530379 RepID=UPI003266CFDC